VRVIITGSNIFGTPVSDSEWVDFKDVFDF